MFNDTDCSSRYDLPGSGLVTDTFKQCITMCATHCACAAGVWGKWMGKWVDGKHMCWFKSKPAHPPTHARQLPRKYRVRVPCDVSSAATTATSA